MTLPELVDMDLPKEGGFHNCALVSMRKRYPLHARKVMHALWGAGRCSSASASWWWTKTWTCTTMPRWPGGCSTTSIGNVTSWWSKGRWMLLDHSSPSPHWGAKIGIDATNEGARMKVMTGSGPPDVVMSAEVKAKVNEMWPQLGLDRVGDGALEGGLGSRPRGTDTRRR